VEAFEYDTFMPGDTRLFALGTGDAPGGVLHTAGWVTGTLVDSSRDWVEAALNRQWPGVMKNFNPELPRAAGEADLAAIPALVETGQHMAAGLDWNNLLGPGRTAAQPA
jgi:hypothetical protein